MPRFVLLMFALLLALPAQAEELTGILRVSSSIQGATVHVDNEVVGEAPLIEKLSVGLHMVRVSADGFDPFVRRVEIFADSTTELQAQLQAGQGSVEFSVQPSGAEIRIDGEVVGTAPIRLGPLSNGAHSYAISAKNHDPVEGEFSYSAGQNVLIVRALESGAGRFEVQSSPAGAEVWLDGASVGVTPLELEGIDLGLHRVRVSLDGYTTVLREVDTSDGARGSISARLEKRGAVLSVSATEDARFLLDGQQLAEGSKLSLELAKGTYLLRVEADGFDPVEDTLSIPSSGRESWRASLAPPDSDEASSLDELPPIWARWYVWTAAGVGAAGAGTATWAIVQASQPDPLPSGDIVVTLP